MGKILRVIRGLFPLGKKDKEKLSMLKGFLGYDDIIKVEYMMRDGVADVEEASLGVSKNFVKDDTYPYIKLKNDDYGESEEFEFVNSLNETVKKKKLEEVYGEFSNRAYEVINGVIASNILGMDDIKKAAALQLFAKEKVHILLLGDPGTGKTNILSDVYKLAPKASFGLGSGTSGAGLSVAMIGNEVVYGLLPLADEGICCIDELNLMRKEDRAALYNAMEKGFVSYDKGVTHKKFKARVRVLATANPKGDMFRGRDVKSLKEQLPFDSALLSRFHLSFLVRKPSKKQFLEITKKIVKHKEKKLSEKDVKFIKDYINYSYAAEPKIPQGFEKKVVDFMDRMKEREKDFLVEISPRLVVGIMNLVKARARMELRLNVNDEDIKEVFDIVEKSLEKGI